MIGNSEWCFEDPPNVAVFVDQRLLNGCLWIYYVGHDAEDGAWQFHGPTGFAEEAQAKVVGLGTLVQLDPSICELADLPLGWCAWRDRPDSPWQRAPQQE